MYQKQEKQKTNKSIEITNKDTCESTRMSSLIAGTHSRKHSPIVIHRDDDKQQHCRQATALHKYTEKRSTSVYLYNTMYLRVY